MNRKLLSWIMILCVLISCLPETVFALSSASESQVKGIIQKKEDIPEQTKASLFSEGSGTCGEELTWTLDEDGILTISGTGAMTDFSGSNIPWVQYRDEIRSVIIEEGVTSIGSYAFYSHNNIVSISFAESITSIGSNTFGNCSGLEELIIPDGVTSIGDHAFYNCWGLKNVSLPEGLSVIEDYLFRKCTLLEEVNLPNSITRIGSWAFADCSNLYNFEIPDGVTFIGSKAFYRCRIQNLEIPDSVTVIGEMAFESCSLYHVTLPQHITTIPYRVFYGCYFDSIEIPESVTMIDMEAFRECWSLRSIVIPEHVTTIYQEAFENCISLEEVELPDSLTYIGATVFKNCRSLKEITLPEGISVIDFSAFYNCRSLERVSIPDSVTSINNSAFSGCSNLRSVSIPSGVTSIKYSAFSGCSSLSDVKIPEGITIIEKNTFQNCSSFGRIEIPNQVTAIEQEAFSGCRSVSSVTLPKTLTTVGDNAFADCENLHDVYFKGNETAWNEIEGTGDLSSDEVNLFSSDDFNESIDVSITIENVPGGAAVSMSSPGRSIFYTLDGSIPCTASIPYEGTFLLDEEGEIFINAIAYDLENGSYGSICTEYLILQKSGSPIVREEGNKVYLTAEGNIYYTLDLTETPSVNSRLYQGPLTFGSAENACILARVIEEGKVPGDIVKYNRVGKVSGGISYPDSTYSFSNGRESFGYGGNYKIDKDRYISILGLSIGSFISEECGSAFAGACYGMSATALLFHQGMLNLSDYSSNAKTVYELHAPLKPGSELTKLIEEYQVSQFGLMLEEYDVFNENLLYSGAAGNTEPGERLLQAVREACDGGDPVILVLSGGSNSDHAVVPYKMENGRIYIYDSKYPYKEGSGEHSIQYSVNANGVYSFTYETYTSISFNLLSTLESALDYYKGFDSENTAVLSAEEVSDMLLSINSDDFSVFDPDGKEVTEYSILLKGDKTVIKLKAGNYSIQNNDKNLNEMTVSAATSTDYYSAVIGSGTCAVTAGLRFGRLSLTVESVNSVNLSVETRDSAGRNNTIELQSKYVEVYAGADPITIVETKTDSVVANGETQTLTKYEDLYRGAVFQLYDVATQQAYDADGRCTLRTDITELPDASFSLSVFVNGAGEDAVLYAASYTETGKMSGLAEKAIEQGRAKYVFDIPKEAKEVKIFVTDHGTYRPLTENIRIQ